MLIASTDGVGTKTAIAAAIDRFDTIGIDLVAMCVDDVVCTGAEPLAFLDYVAVGQLDPVAVAELVSGVAAGCREAGCALIGGETAEHPGLMEADAFDIAGTAIGVVERSRILDGSGARAGDAIVGLDASGFHSNGFSLVRALVAQWDLDPAEPYQVRLRRTLGDAAADDVLRDAPQETMATLGEILLTPTRIYARAVLAAREALVAAGSDLHGLAHITGGGLPGNVPRALPDGLAARLDPTRWRMPSVMHLFGALGGMDDQELRATFNGGIGMIAVVAPDAVPVAIEALAAHGVPGRLVGEVLPSSRPAAVGTSRDRSRSWLERTHRGRRIRRGLEPARAPRIRGPRRARRGGRSWSSPTVPARPSTGPRSRASTRPWSRTATTAHWPRRSPAPGRTSSCWPATCASSVPRCWRRSRTGSSTRIRRSCRRSRVRTRSRTRSRTARP